MSGAEPDTGGGGGHSNVFQQFRDDFKFKSLMGKHTGKDGAQPSKAKKSEELGREAAASASGTILSQAQAKARERDEKHAHVDRWLREGQEDLKQRSFFTTLALKEREKMLGEDPSSASLGAAGQRAFRDALLRPVAVDPATPKNFATGLIADRKAQIRGGSGGCVSRPGTSGPAGGSGSGLEAASPTAAASSSSGSAVRPGSAAAAAQLGVGVIRKLPLWEGPAAQVLYEERVFYNPTMVAVRRRRQELEDKKLLQARQAALQKTLSAQAGAGAGSSKGGQPGAGKGKGSGGAEVGGGKTHSHSGSEAGGAQQQSGDADGHLGNMHQMNLSSAAQERALIWEALCGDLAPDGGPSANLPPTKKMKSPLTPASSASAKMKNDIKNLGKIMSVSHERFTETNNALLSELAGGEGTAFGAILKRVKTSGGDRAGVFASGQGQGHSGDAGDRDAQGFGSGEEAQGSGEEQRAGKGRRRGQTTALVDSDVATGLRAKSSHSQAAAASAKRDQKERDQEARQAATARRASEAVGETSGDGGSESGSDADSGSEFEEEGEGDGDGQDREGRRRSRKRKSRSSRQRSDSPSLSLLSERREQRAQALLLHQQAQALTQQAEAAGAGASQRGVAVGSTNSQEQQALAEQLEQAQRVLQQPLPAVSVVAPRADVQAIQDFGYDFVGRVELSRNGSRPATVAGQPAGLSESGQPELHKLQTYFGPISHGSTAPKMR